MEKKEYKLEVNRRERKPRSKRLRDLGAAGTGSGSTVVEVSGSGSQHSHANLSTLDKLSADDDGYVYLNHLREGTDDEGNPVWATEREKIKSCYADTAQNLSEDSSDWEKIEKKDAEMLQSAKTYTDETALSKVHADTAQKLITFKEGLAIGNVILTYDETNKALRVANVNKDAQVNLYTTGGVSGYRFSGIESGGSGGSVDVKQILQSGTHIATINDVKIYAPDSAAGASSWAELTGKPAWLTDTTPAVSVFQNDAGYITAAALAGYPTTNQVATLIDNTEQTIKDWVKAKNYATQSYVDAAKVTGYAADMDTVGQDIRLIDEEGNIITAVIAPYAQYTEGIGKPYGDFPGLRSYYWEKKDNSGYPTYLLVSKVCAASEWSSWGTGHPMYGISGTVHGRRSGNMNGTGTWHINAAVSYRTDYIKTETSDATYMQPCVVTYGGNVYVALRLLGSGYDMMFLGSGYNLLDSPIQVNCTDLSGTCPSVTVLRDYTGVRLTAKDLDVAGSLVVAGNVNTNFDISAGGSLSVTGESRFSGAVYLPGQFTFFGQNKGIYIEADFADGKAAYIGVHQSFNGNGTIAHVNLDGTVRLWHCVGINQDPDADASLRVGGLSKLYYLTLGGIARPDGYWFASPNGYFGNPSTGTYTAFGDGGLELSATKPYIDFHFGKSTADYTSRLIASEDGVLMIDSVTADPALRIGKAYLRYDTVNNALYVTGQDGAQVNLYATGGLAAYSAIGSVTQLANLQLTGRLTARSAVFTGMVQASSILLDNFTLDTNNEYFEIRYNGLDYAENQLVLDVYGDIYSEGYLYVNGKTWLNETYIGSQASTYKITGIYADGINVYITINGKKYKLANA